MMARVIMKPIGKGMIFSINGNNYTFRTHVPDQEPYERRDPHIGWARLDGESIPRRLLMNSHLTPQGNVSRRVSIQHSNGSWYYRDDEGLRELAVASTADRPLVFTTVA